MRYRHDIDGLRAISIILVVFYHAFPNFFLTRSGFVGVDIFFVISGFLITTIILMNIENDSFSFLDFYFRRIKRIFPSLIIVFSSTLLFGWFVLLANEYRQLGKHVFGGAVFASNFILLKEIGYFDNTADTKPLLHLWSLGIEEQFYFFWPLIIIFTRHLKIKIFFVILIFGLISFFTNLNLIKFNNLEAFYLPQSRFWELLSGSLIAFLHLHKPSSLLNIIRVTNIKIGDVAFKKFKNQYFIENASSWIGLILLLISSSLIDRDSNFPGFWAILPVIGAMCLIAGGSNSFVNRKFLSCMPLVFVGRISFPLYLWHWPLLSFARIIENQTPDRLVRLLVVVLAFLLSIVTFKFIENPLRHNKNKYVAIYLLFIMCLIAMFGFIVYKKDGFENRVHANLSGYSGDIGHIEFHRFISERYYLCKPSFIAKSAPTWEGYVRCMQSLPNDDIDIALIGDSHAEHLFLGIASSLPTKNIVFYIKRSSPFINNNEFHDIFKYINDSKAIHTVILSMNWEGAAIPNNSSLNNEISQVIDFFAASGKKVLITDDVPSFPFSALGCKGQRWPLLNQELVCVTDAIENSKVNSYQIKQIEKAIKNKSNAHFISINQYLCNQSYCSMTAGKDLLFRDNNHLNINGSIFIGGKLVKDNASLFD